MMTITKNDKTKTVTVTAKRITTTTIKSIETTTGYQVKVILK